MSSAQRNPLTASFAENVSRAVRSLVCAGGPVRVTTGVPRSTIVQECEAVAVFPAPSVARTSKRCGPSARPVYEAWPDAQAAKSAASRRHSRFAPSVAEKAKLAFRSSFSAGGPVSVTTGGVWSTTVQP